MQEHILAAGPHSSRGDTRHQKPVQKVRSSPHSTRVTFPNPCAPGHPSSSSPHPTPAGCKTVHYDLVFLLDTSSSVGKEDFEKVRQWVANLVDTFEVGPDRTRVGVVRYSDRPTTAFELGLFGSREAVKAAARHLAYHGGNTNTGDALRFITRHSFSPQAGGRPGDRAFKQVAILLTDGRSQDLVLDAAAAAHRAGIRIFAVGVGAALKEELEEIASKPKSAHVFHVSDFNAIDKIRGKLRRRLCESECAQGMGPEQRGAPSCPLAGGRAARKHVGQGLSHRGKREPVWHVALLHPGGRRAPGSAHTGVLSGPRLQGAGGKEIKEGWLLGPTHPETWRGLNARSLIPISVGERICSPTGCPGRSPGSQSPSGAHGR